MSNKSKIIITATLVLLVLLLILITNSPTSSRYRNQQGPDVINDPPIDQWPKLSYPLSK